MDALEMTLLFDYYGGLLTEKQRACFDMRYNQDLSLGEIGQTLGVSRQAVCDNLNRAAALLRNVEDNVGCVSRNQKIRKNLGQICKDAQVLCEHGDSAVKEAARRILAAARELEA